jgi:SAM-dependent methyltransferase
VTTQIATEAAVRCPVCGADGAVLYEGLRDRMFGAPGEWRYRRCGSCGLVWQDPLVTEADVGRLYATYYTHAEPEDPGNSLVRRLYKAAQRGHLASRYGYPADQGTSRVAGWLLGLHPGRRADADFRAMYLPASARGRLLDVGCGHGAILADLRDLGWDAQGIEPDPVAAGVARSRGLRVAEGGLFTADVPPASMDVVVMSHVIEHLHHPIEALRRCHALLAPGGTLVAITPNNESHGHAAFGRHWRGLEPPRHLQIFSRASLGEAARRAGFAHVHVDVTIRNARGIYDASCAIRAAEGGEGLAQVPASTVGAELWQFAEWCRTWWRTEAGEELVLHARRGAA